MRISVKALKKLCNPVRNTPWGCGYIATAMVRRCVEANDLLGEPVHHEVWDSKIWHARRIAHMLVHGWSGNIQVDVGVPSRNYYPTWPLEDGNHRFFAAIMRKDDYIDGDIGGDLDYAIGLGLITEEDITKEGLREAN